MTHYAIIDGAQRPHLQKRLDTIGVSYRSLFDGTAEEALQDIAPLLCAGVGDTTDDLRWHRELRALGERKPAVSVITSGASLDALAVHFRKFHLVRVPEQGGRDMLLRWYDTRILPVWLQLMQPHQQAAFLGNIGHWRYFDRYGDMHELPLPAPLTEGFPALSPLRLDTDQYARFLDACEPDIAIAQLRRVIPDETRRVPYRRLYPFVHAHLQDSLAHGVVALDDHVQYLLLALYTSGGFRRHPAVTKRLAQPADAWENLFSDWATALPDEIWETGAPLWESERDASQAFGTSF